MGDLSFDVIVVGGGTTGLSTGMYLAKYGGLTVGIFEETHELGGGLAGDQLAPGIQCNTHAASHPWWYYGTVIKDDFPELWEEGLNLDTEVSSQVYAFDDNSCLALYGQQIDPDGTRSAKEIARYSQKDADTYLRLRDIYLNHILPTQIEGAFSVPKPMQEPGFGKAFSHPDVIKAGINPYTMSMPSTQAAKYFYESLEAQYVVLKLGAMADFFEGLGVQAMTSVYSMFDYRFIVGGSHNLAHCLKRVLYKYGAKSYTHSAVEKVIVENGVAKGIQLRDGSRIEAKKAVVSTLSPHQLCYDLIGAEYLGPEIMHKIECIERSGGCGSCLTVAFAETPTFKCSSSNPDVYSKEMRSGVNYFNMGPKSLESLMEESSIQKTFKIAGYKTPRSKLMNVAINPHDTQLCRDPKVSLWDFFVPAPPAWAQTKEFWIKYQDEFAEWQLDELKKYADGASWDNVIGVSVRSPYWVAEHLKNMGPAGNVGIVDMIPSQMGANRPIPELAQHRTPVKNLYATGAGFGNWGMSSFCGSYTCYKVMSEDHQLTMPWKDKGRSY